MAEDEDHRDIFGTYPGHTDSGGDSDDEGSQTGGATDVSLAETDGNDSQARLPSIPRKEADESGSSAPVKKYVKSLIQKKSQAYRSQRFRAE